MNSISAFPHSGPSSTVASVSDLDGFTIGRDAFLNSYNPAEQDEFGFDPPADKSAHSRFDAAYSPPELNGDLWPGFEREEDLKQPQHLELDKLLTQSLPGSASAVSRFGQVTPPRTDSAGSAASITGASANSASASPKSVVPARRRKSKGQRKDSESSTATTSSGRKRKSTRKAAAADAESPAGPDDAKRKASLEKNRLAAAKCRINKKEKTEQLQRDSHDKAVHNAFLKDQVMQMKEEIQQINAMLLSHANCKGCKAPDEIQKHMTHMGSDYLNSHVHMGHSNYGELPSLSLDDMPPMAPSHVMNDSYFPSLGADHDPTLMNPPLPDFDRSAEFDVHTPMQTD